MEVAQLRAKVQTLKGEVSRGGDEKSTLKSWVAGELSEFMTTFVPLVW